jgi:SatD family (SatD)
MVSPKSAGSAVVAVLGDIVRSKRLDAAARNEVQSILHTLMEDVSRRYERSILGGFLMTIGDEFQGLLGVPDVVPEIVQDIREKLPRLKFRIAVSLGELTTERPRGVALGSDGPAWHAARQLLEQWRAAKRDGVAFTGFGSDDVVLNGVSGLLTHHWAHLEASQREIVNALRHHQGLRKEAAAEMAISQQALSNRAQTAGWREYEAGMIAWREVLSRHAPSGPLRSGGAAPQRPARPGAERES